MLCKLLGKNIINSNVFEIFFYKNWIGFLHISLGVFFGPVFDITKFDSIRFVLIRSRPCEENKYIFYFIIKYCKFQVKVNCVLLNSSLILYILDNFFILFLGWHKLYLIIIWINISKIWKKILLINISKNIIGLSYKIKIRISFFSSLSSAGKIVMLLLWNVIESYL